LEDLIGILVFLAIAVISALGKAEERSKGQRTRRPRSLQPPVQRHPPAPAPRTGRSPLPPTAPERSSGKGRLQPETSPVRPGLEPEQPAVQTAQSLARPAFGQQLGAAIRAERETFARRSGALSSLARPESEGDQADAPETHPLAAILASRDGLSQAILLAEVLGKPKALRRGR